MTTCAALVYGRKIGNGRKRTVHDRTLGDLFNRKLAGGLSAIMASGWLALKT